LFGGGIIRVEFKLSEIGQKAANAQSREVELVTYSVRRPGGGYIGVGSIQIHPQRMDPTQENVSLPKLYIVNTADPRVHSQPRR
jgi:hypothetical protein